MAQQKFVAGTTIRAVYDVLKDYKFHTLHEIVQVTGLAPASASARIRDLRKKQYGAFTVESQRNAGGGYQYRLKRAKKV